MLDGDGVRLDAIVDTDEPTTLALAELDAAGAATYRFYDGGTSAAGLTPEAAVAALPAATEILHVGTLRLAREPISAALEALVERAAGRAMVVLDPNCRPDALQDPEPLRARVRRIAARADLVKASEEDLEWMEPGAAPVAAARALLADGAAATVITRGAEGALIVTADTEVEIPAPRVDVVDTIGAGDAFGGSLVAWWRREGLDAAALADLDALAEATRFACLVAARTCERPGAQPPRLSEL
jgi:fructokinase